MKNGQLNMGVVAPPDKLPNASIYNTIHQYDTPKAVISKSEGFSAGKLSAGCAVGALFLSLVSLLPVIRKH